MMPLKAAALLWASIMLLVATSNTCNGRMLKEEPFVYTERVNLGNAWNFTVLAYATVTNTGPTNVGGYIGVSPKTAVTGEDSMNYTYSESNPAPYGGRADPGPAADAKADVTAAYLDAAGRVAHVININPGNLGGLNFTPGLYKTTGALTVSSGILTLSGGAASGLSDGVFIFQMEETLIVSDTCKIVLTDGAQAKNVFWKIGSAAEFGVDTEVVGTFLAEAAIVVKTRANVVGRLFSNSASVNLDSNDIVFPN